MKVESKVSETFSFSDRLIKKDFEILAKPKLLISRKLVETMLGQDLSVRKLAEKVGMKHPQIIRVTGNNNYNIDTLLRILDALDLELVIQSRKEVKHNEKETLPKGLNK